MDKRWSDKTEYIPGAPEGLEAHWETRQDQQGNVFPVINARWKMGDDGSISYLNGTELHVLWTATNQDLCVRYTFFERLKSRNPSGEKWSFSVASVVVDPGQTYLVSVFNIPKPEPLHSGYDIRKEITVPDCHDPRMKISKYCIESGSLWNPNITEVMDSDTLHVGFNTDRLAKRYRVLVQCQSSRQHKDAYMNNMTSLNVTFNIKDWPLSCCHVAVEIQPFFLECRNDCSRRRKIFSICEDSPPTSSVSVTYLSIGFGLVFLCAVIACTLYAVLKPKTRPYGGGATSPPFEERKENLGLASQPPKLLVIYSQDHPLYRAVVLKLCAFLTAKCGTQVAMDLLDAATVGAVGATRWLEWQRRQLRHPMDKVLILCSRGVQAKWRAMCGERRVLLREDVLSPNDDMLVPFLNLFLPNMHRPAALGKYIVAYFDDVSDERDVPSVFDIAVKYRLMKHFEELYFRILEMEKYQPGRVNHIEGIGREEYFNCPSGGALRDAIETFRAYQTENPGWFEAECVASEEEAVAGQNLLNKPPEIQPVLERVPLIQEGRPLFINDVEVVHDADPVYVQAPQPAHKHEASHVVVIEPRVNPASRDPYRINEVWVNPPAGRVTQQRPRCNAAEEPVLVAGLSPSEPPQVCQQWLRIQGEPGGRGPAEDDEQEDRAPASFPGTVQRLAAPQYPSRSDMENLQRLQPLLEGPEPVEVGEEELLLRLSEKGPSTGSDQGYISRDSSQRGRPEPETDALIALARLQEELFQTTLT
ncbi:unnamed protein product [Merluccius merluccius]